MILVIVTIITIININASVCVKVGGQPTLALVAPDFCVGSLPEKWRSSSSSLKGKS